MAEDSSSAHRRSAPLSRPPSSADGPDKPQTARIADDLITESHRRERRLRVALATADTLALAAALASTVPLADSDPLNPHKLLAFPAIVAAAKILGLYGNDDQRIRKTTADELPDLAKLGLLLVLGLWLGDALLVGAPVSKLQALAVGTIFVVAVVIGRWVARRLATRGLPRERCLFVGDELSYRRLATVFARHQLTSDLVGYAAIGQMLGAVPHTAADSRLRELIADHRVHRIIVGPYASTNAETFELLEAARSIGARVSLLPDMLEVVGSSVDFDDLYGVTLLGVRHRQLSDSSILLKRGFDLVGASILLILLAPLMAVIAGAIRLESGRPILVRQSRIGRGGAPFGLIKFRTMVSGSDPMTEGLAEFAPADPRTTAVGRHLRRRSLDDLPQLVNVLRNSMSLVGPRPLVPAEHRRVVGVRRGRLRLTPGITGPWQIAGGARVPLEDMVKLDHIYVTTWTIWLDVKILIRTVPYMLGLRGS